MQIDDDHDSALYLEIVMKLECAGETTKLVTDDKEYNADLLYGFADDRDKSWPTRTHVALSTKAPRRRAHREVRAYLERAMHVRR